MFSPPSVVEFYTQYKQSIVTDMYKYVITGSRHGPFSSGEASSVLKQLSCRDVGMVKQFNVAQSLCSIWRNKSKSAVMGGL